MVEVSIEVGDVRNKLVDRVFVFVGDEDGSAEAWVTEVDTLILSRLTSLFRRHEGIVVDCLIHPLVVPELIGVDTIFLIVREVHGGLVDVVDKVITRALADNPVLADDLGDGTIVLSTEGNLDDLRGEIDKMSLVVHERGDVAGLVPDQKVLPGC